MSRGYLVTPEILSSLGVTPGPGPVGYVFQDLFGAQFTLQVSPSNADLIWLPWGDAALWRRNSGVNYWYQYLPTTQTIYFAYNSCSEMPDLSFADFVNQMIQFGQKQPVSHWVVDLRNNAGGNSLVFQPFLTMLAGFDNPSQEIAAIIGQRTFSSGMSNATDLSYKFGIPLVGQATGGSPASYGDNQVFSLPNSGLEFSCSTQFIGTYPGYAGDTLMPNLPVAMSSADYFANYDPFPTAALMQPGPFYTPQAGGAAPAIVNAASFGGPISPGEWAAVFGDFSGVTAETAAALPFPTSLGGVQVQVNGVAAPLLAVSPSQINSQVPSATAAGSAQIAISVASQNVATGTAQVVSSSPGIFLADFVNLNRPGAVLDANNQLNSSTELAKRSDLIQIYATGAGPLTQSVADRTAAPYSPLAETIVKPRVFIGGEEAAVEFSGLTPSCVGLWQINARIPDVDTITGGLVPVVVVANGGYASNAVTIWVE
jgi:uncharacterized protein (TIGR03437 family)